MMGFFSWPAPSSTKHECTSMENISRTSTILIPQLHLISPSTATTVPLSHCHTWKTVSPTTAYCTGAPVTESLRTVYVQSGMRAVSTRSVVGSMLQKADFQESYPLRLRFRMTPSKQVRQLLVSDSPDIEPRCDHLVSFHVKARAAESSVNLNTRSIPSRELRPLGGLTHLGDECGVERDDDCDGLLYSSLLGSQLQNEDFIGLSE